MAKFRLTKKAIAIIIVVISILVGGAAGFIIWRVNQQEQVSPEGSEAGTCVCKTGSSCPSDKPQEIGNDGCASGRACCPNKGPEECAICGDNDHNKCNSVGQQRCEINNGKWCWVDDSTCGSSPSPPPTDDDGSCPSSGGSVGQTCHKNDSTCAYGCSNVSCPYPKATYCSGTCECRDWDNQGPGGCETLDLGTPPACPDGMVSCQPGENGCSQQGTYRAYCDPCNNPTDVPYYCKSTGDDETPTDDTTENVCEDGGLDAPVAGTLVNPGQPIGISGWAWDHDGVTNFNLVINGETQSGAPIISTEDRGGHSNATTWRYRWTVPSDATNGQRYSINVSWTDGKGVGGANCAVSTYVDVTVEIQKLKCGNACSTEGETCTIDGTECTTISDGGAYDGQRYCVDPNNYTEDVIDSAYFARQCTWEQVNPAWNIEKTSQVVCINEYTENVTARVDYYISVTNVQGGGILDHVVDRPNGVEYDWLIPNSINLGGEAIRSTSNSDMIGEIRWNLTGSNAQFTEGEVKSNFLTYSVEIPCESQDNYQTCSNFGTYNNTVTGYPGPSDENAFSFIQSTVVGCFPYTGLFDSARGKIILGVILLILGIVYAVVGESALRVPVSVLYGMVGVDRDHVDSLYKAIHSLHEKRRKERISKNRERFERDVTKSDK